MKYNYEDEDDYDDHHDNDEDEYMNLKDEDEEEEEPEEKEYEYMNLKDIRSSNYKKMLKDDEYDKYDQDVISRRRKSNTDNNNNFGKIEEENKTTVQKVFEIIGSIIGFVFIGASFVFLYNHPEGILPILFLGIVAGIAEEFSRF